MGTENSSKETRSRAKELSNAIGSYHIDLNMDTVVTSVQTLFTLVTNKTPRFKVHGGSEAENLALQNIQVQTLISRTNLYRRGYEWFWPTFLRSFCRGHEVALVDCLSLDHPTLTKP
jgi:NAD+ synthase (glutamine-hydrolysing)